MKQSSLKSQTGAALIVALILLVALTLLGIASMNTASLDLIMAGNEQYRSRSFVTAEAGVEAALAGGTFDTSTDSSGSGTAGSDSYAYQITRPNGGALEDPPPGYSTAEGSTTFKTVYFRITSNGTSQRGAKSASVQEVYEVVKSGDTTTCVTSIGGCTLN